ncbi:hypothetical protein PoB_005739300 [Plakobranchus ocellatus]|uniref:Uncharacterized protein n=1 Tax=Plakobranchus ocellatus TaxID=259542 RepID=A0AAV4CH63_9GAST|nr:hypothetical protein PoB_005739300 [Plakobranchus ocellatus]
MILRQIPPDKCVTCGQAPAPFTRSAQEVPKFNERHHPVWCVQIAMLHKPGTDGAGQTSGLYLETPEYPSLGENANCKNCTGYRTPNLSISVHTLSPKIGWSVVAQVWASIRRSFENRQALMFAFFCSQG